MWVLDSFLERKINQCWYVQIPHIKEIQLDPSRLAAFMLAEVSFLVALASLDNAISQAAAKGLRLISYAERMPGAPVNPYINDDDKSKRNPIYEQLGDPGAPIGKHCNKFFLVSFLFTHLTGRLNHQRRIRKLIRMLTFSAGIQVVVWQECYNRWRVLDDKIHIFCAVSSLPENPSYQVGTRHQPPFVFGLLNFASGRSIPVAKPHFVSCRVEWRMLWGGYTSLRVG